MTPFGWQLVLTSAAVAAIVSAIATLIGQALERRARRRELLLTKAIELAIERRRHRQDIADRQGAPVAWQDDIVTAETYFGWLSSLFDTGKLPEDPRIRRITRDAEGNLIDEKGNRID